MKSTTSLFRRTISATHQRSAVTALMLLMPCTFVLSALPVAALAQPALPEVRSLDVTTDGDLPQCPPAGRRPTHQRHGLAGHDLG